MASNKVEIDVGGKYSAAQAFKQLDADIKTSGKGLKDMGQAATQVASNVADAFDTKLSGAMKNSLGILGEMARGGIWGAMSAIANTTISFIAEKFRKAKEEAQKFADLCRNETIEAMKTLGINLGNVSRQIDTDTAKAKDMLAVLNGEVASKAETKVHELNIKAMQQITDNMTSATKNAIMATAALEGAEVKAAAIVEQASNNTKNAQTTLDAARQKREAAENALSEAQTKRAEFEQNATAYGNGWLAEYRELQSRATQSTEQLMANGLALEQALAFRKGATLALAKFEEEHKNEVSALNEVTKLETTAKTSLETAKRGEESATTALTLATQREEVARSSSAEMVESAKQKYYDANAALDAETQQRQQQMAREQQLDEIKARLVELNIQYADYQDLINKGLENNYLTDTIVARVKSEYATQLQTELDERKRAWMEGVLQKLSIEEKNYANEMGLLTTLLEDGYSQETAINVARARYKDALEQQAKSMEDSSKGNDEGKAGGFADLLKGIEKIVGGTTVNTSLNSGEVKHEVDSSKEVINIGDIEREVREEEAEVRKHTAAVKSSSLAVKNYLNGKLSPEVAEKMGQKMKALGWTKNDFEQAGKKAIQSQLLSMSKQEKQQKDVDKIANALAKMGLK